MKRSESTVTMADLEKLLATMGVPIVDSETPVSANATTDVEMLPAMVKVTASGHGVTSNSIPLGGGKLVLTGKCDEPAHKGTHGREYRLYVLGLCGDHNKQVMHVACARTPNDACKSRGGRVFSCRDAADLSRAGCQNCAREARKALELASK